MLCVDSLSVELLIGIRKPLGLIIIIIIIIIIKRRSGINPIPPTVKDRDYKETKAKYNDDLLYFI